MFKGWLRITKKNLFWKIYSKYRFYVFSFIKKSKLPFLKNLKTLLRSKKSLDLKKNIFLDCQPIEPKYLWIEPGKIFWISSKKTILVINKVLDNNSNSQLSYKSLTLYEKTDKSLVWEENWLN